jgi:hypothetical protein
MPLLNIVCENDTYIYVKIFDTVGVKMFDISAPLHHYDWTSPEPFLNGAQERFGFVHLAYIQPDIQPVQII